jgi:hypothetical protein
MIFMDAYYNRRTRLEIPQKLRNIAPMWGNWLGWCISALLVLGTTVLVHRLQRNMEVVSERTDFSRNIENGSAIVLPLPPTLVVPGMTEPTDAGPIYRRAIEAYLGNPPVYDSFARSGRTRDIDDVPAINILLEATACKRAGIFISQPAEIVNYDAEKPALRALATLGACGRRAGQLIEKDRPTDALRFYDATFALGVKLYQERLTWAELDVGLTLIAESSKLIMSLDPARTDAVGKFDRARQQFVIERVQPTLRVIASADDAVIERHAGDVAWFARHAEDRMWRVEAIFKMGRYRFNAGRIGDQHAAELLLKDLCDDPDPVIQTAARAARDLTIEQYRMLR